MPTRPLFSIIEHPAHQLPHFHFHLRSGVGGGEGRLLWGGRVSAVNIHTDEKRVQSGYIQMARIKNFPVIEPQFLFPFRGLREDCLARPTVCYTVYGSKGTAVGLLLSFTSESTGSRQSHPIRYALTSPWYAQVSMCY